MREMTAAGGPLLEKADTTWVTWLLRQLVLAALAIDRVDEAERYALRAVEHAERFGLTVGACRAATAHADVPRAARHVGADRARARHRRPRLRRQVQQGGGGEPLPL